jgi:hypothetical protein
MVGISVRRRFVSVNSDVTPSQIQFCSRYFSFGDKRRDWPELPIQFLFESALFRRGRSSKCVRAVDRMNRRNRILKLRRTSEVETTDDADDADKQELGGETGRMSPKHAPQMEPVYHP